MKFLCLFLLVIGGTALSHAQLDCVTNPIFPCVPPCCTPDSKDLRMLPFGDTLGVSNCAAGCDFVIRKVKYAPSAPNTMGNIQDRYYYEMEPANPIPDTAFVLLHGGGFCGGSAESGDYMEMATVMLQRGYRVYSIEHRRGWLDDVDTDGDGTSNTFPEGCLDGTPCTCLYCDNLFEELPRATDMALLDVKLAIDHLQAGNNRRLIWYGASGGASMGLKLLVNEDFGYSRGFILGVIKSGAWDLPEKRITFNVPLYIIHNQQDITASFITGPKYPKYCCYYSKMTVGGGWYFDRYREVRSTLQSKPNQGGKKARAYLVSICDGQHGDQFPAYAYCSYLPDAINYLHNVINKKRWMFDSSWQENKLYTLTDKTDPFSGACFNQCPPPSTALFPPSCASVTGATCAERGIVCLPPLLRPESAIKVVNGAVIVVEGPSDWTLIDLSGRIVQTGFSGNGYIDFTSLDVPAGFYLVLVRLESGHSETVAVLK